MDRQQGAMEDEWYEMERQRRQEQDRQINEWQ